MPSSPLSALVAALERIGSTYDDDPRDAGFPLPVRCRRCKSLVLYCDGALPQGVCPGQVARAALRAWRERPPLREDRVLRRRVALFFDAMTNDDEEKAAFILDAID